MSPAACPHSLWWCVDWHALSVPQSRMCSTAATPPPSLPTLAFALLPLQDSLLCVQLGMYDQKVAEQKTSAAAAKIKPMPMRPAHPKRQVVWDEQSVDTNDPVSVLLYPPSPPRPAVQLTTHPPLPCVSDPDPYRTTPLAAGMRRARMRWRWRRRWW